MTKRPLGGEIIEAAINAYVGLDPELQAGLGKLAGKRIGIAATGTEFRFYLCFEQDGVRWVSHVEEPPDIMLEATPLALLRLLTTSAQGHGVSGAEITIKGEVAEAQRLRSLIRRRNVDPEELLSKVIGDVAARQVGNLARGLVGAGRQTTATLLQDLGEYLTEERRMTPARTELDALVSAVEDLRDDAERLDKRIRRLQQRGRSEQRE